MSKMSDLHIEQQESGESHSPNQCNLCGKIVDERAMQEQCGLSLCISCDGKYSDEELFDMLEITEEEQEAIKKVIPHWNHFGKDD